MSKKQGSPIPISGFTRGRKKQRADAVSITFHAPWRTRSAPCMCWTPLPYFCWQQFFQGTLDGPFVMRHDLVLFGQHHNASRIYIHVILLLYRLYIIGTSLHLRIKHNLCFSIMQLYIYIYVVYVYAICLFILSTYYSK